MKSRWFVILAVLLTLGLVLVACQGQVQEAARDFIDDCWQLVENEIGEGPYFLSQSYSVIDPYLLMLTNWHDDPQALFERFPKLKRLCDVVRGRPAVERIWNTHFPPP